MLLFKLELIHGICENIRESSLDVKEQYDLIFSDATIGQVSKLAALIGTEFKYYDPDTSYEEDMDAFIFALRNYIDDADKSVSDGYDTKEYYAALLNRIADS
jgi:hypothetical protein